MYENTNIQFYCGSGTDRNKARRTVRLLHLFYFEPLFYRYLTNRIAVSSTITGADMTSER